MKELLQNPEVKAVLRDMYDLYRSDPVAFVMNKVKENPQIAQALQLKELINNPQLADQYLGQLFNECGITPEDMMQALQ